jgi:hypothetical protein
MFRKLSSIVFVLIFMQDYMWLYVHLFLTNHDFGINFINL